MLTIGPGITGRHEFLGVFTYEEDPLPSLIIGTTAHFQPVLKTYSQVLDLSLTTPAYAMGAKTCILRPFQPEVQDPEAYVSGWIRRVRIVSNAKGVLLYVGVISSLEFDPGRWAWPDKSPLLSYSAKKGRRLLSPRTSISRTIPDKWKGVLPASYKPKWSEVWKKNRPQKDAAFIWSLYHQAIAVNKWRAQISPTISDVCTSCDQGTCESILHRFFDCSKTQAAWSYGQAVLYQILDIPPTNAAWPSFTWQQCLLKSKLPRQLKQGTYIWSLLRGSIIWIT